MDSKDRVLREFAGLCMAEIIRAAIKRLIEVKSAAADYNKYYLELDTSTWNRSKIYILNISTRRVCNFRKRILILGN